MEGNFSKEDLLARFNAIRSGTLMETLDMEYVDVDPEAGSLKIKMPVGPKVHQPAGFLHGGASAALAESVGSASGMLYVDPQQYNVLGISLSCNHLRSLKAGWVYGTARIIHKGRTTHLWEIEIRDEQERLISHCKLTNMIVAKERING